ASISWGNAMRKATKFIHDKTEQIEAELNAKLAQSEFFKRLRLVDPEAIARAKHVREAMDREMDRPRRMEEIAKRQVEATHGIAEAMRQQAKARAERASSSGRKHAPSTIEADKKLRSEPVLMTLTGTTAVA